MASFLLSLSLSHGSSDRIHSLQSLIDWEEGASVPVGLEDGAIVGSFVGFDEATPVGAGEGAGDAVGYFVGAKDGTGTGVGAAEG